MIGHVFFSRYQAVRLLGEGGMGKVYFGRQLHPAREVVIKVMHERIAAQPRFRQKFQQEVAVLTRLQHPCIVQLLEGGVDPQAGPCLVMEYLAGQPLETLRRQHRRFAPERVGRWLMQICGALHVAHTLSIVHRDIKPENIMILGPDGPAERVKILDFGLAQWTAVPHFALEKLQGHCTHIGGGTPDYLPPEQVRGEPVDRRGDIYSTGVMLFQLLTGRLPFNGQDVREVLLAHREMPPPSFAQALLGSDLPPAVEAVVQACLAKSPDDRPQSAGDLAGLYEEALGIPILDPELFTTPEPAAPAPVIVPKEPEPDPRSVVHQLEAWMPESIAVVKLRGFAEDNGGQVVDSAPGVIRLRFRDTPAPPPPRGGLMSWLGGTTPPPRPPTLYTAMELRMQRKPSDRQTLLLLTVFLRPEGGSGRLRNPEWKALAEQRFRDLRAYLMGSRA